MSLGFLRLLGVTGGALEIGFVQGMVIAGTGQKAAEIICRHEVGAHSVYRQI